MKFREKLSLKDRGRGVCILTGTSALLLLGAHFLECIYHISHKYLPTS